MSCSADNKPTDITMANVEISMDSNMNKTDNNSNKFELSIEETPSSKAPSEPIRWGRILALVGAAAVLAACTTVSWLLWGWLTGLQIFAIVLLQMVIVFNWRWIYVAIRTSPRDVKALYCYSKILRLDRRFTKSNWAMPEIFHQFVKKHPLKPCFLFKDETWTFQQVEEYSLRVTAVLKGQGIKPGHTVAVMLNNCPELPATWLGVSRCGAVSPLINTNQTGKALLHSVNIVKCEAVIYEDCFDNAFKDLAGELSPSIKLFKFTRRPLVTGGQVNIDTGVNVANGNQVNVANGDKNNVANGDQINVANGDTVNNVANGDQVNVANGDRVNVVGAIDFTSMLERTQPIPWSRYETMGYNDKMLYIYTSGTTGLPKAAVISSSRMLFMASGVHFLGGMNNKDIMYCPMPLYHSAGGVISVGQAFLFGCTVVLRTKFSASAYFPDCIKYKCTAAHYIGEMCRYVLATPPAPTDKQHSVRTVYGNGMRPTIWNDFVKRFNIKRVVEFYGATEGNANIVNIDNKPGAIGFVSRIIPAVYPIAVIKVDEATGEPIRNSKGFCQIAQPNEPGVFIGKIKPNNPSRAFLGYADKEATDKKVVRNVFSKGDSAFISGDVLVADELGYLFFKDRTGDTFRWRGENVSTTEVEAVISKCSDQRDAVVYGVEIPNTDGRAGMCGIVDEDGTLDLERLATNMAKDLPAYARPVFVRVMTKLEMTGTFKLKKVDLQKEGFDPSKIKDNLYYLDLKQGKYLRLGIEEFQKICTGQIRL